LIAGINFLLSIVFYWQLPRLQFVFQGGTSIFEEGLPRALVSGLGFQVLVHSSLFDFKLRGESVGVGFDVIYKSILAYLLKHHRNQMSHLRRNDYLKAYDSIPHHLRADALREAAEWIVISKRPDDDGAEVRHELRLIMAAPGVSNEELCASMYMFIRKNTPNRAVAIDLIKRAQKKLQDFERR